MRHLTCLPIILATLVLAACGDKAPKAPTQDMDPTVRERIRAWMTGFDNDRDTAAKAYGLGEWILPGDKASGMDRQVIVDAPCETLALASNRPVAAKSAGGKSAQVRALWLYTVAGCAGTNTAQQVNALASLETARRSLRAQWEKELEVLPGSVRIEAKAGDRAKIVAASAALTVSEYTSCLATVAGQVRANSRKITWSQLDRECGATGKAMHRFAACPIDWVATRAHGMADAAQQPRDGDAWVGDATARYRMAWRGCDDTSLTQWQTFVAYIPADLREGRLKRISAPQDPLLACHFRLFRKLVTKYGPINRAYKDNDVIVWCGQQFGLQSLSNRLDPPDVFTPAILNDSGKKVSWLYDPGKQSLRPDAWRFDNCMRGVAQRMAQEGHNLPNPETLSNYCRLKGGVVAADYISGKALIEGRNKSGPEPE